MVETDCLGSLVSPLIRAAARRVSRAAIRGLIVSCLLSPPVVLRQTIADDASPPAADPGSSLPPLIHGTVTAIIDGDTLHVTSAGHLYLVDLAGVDAPEKGQAAGDMAAQVLHLKVMQKQVQLLPLPPSSADLNVQPVTPVPTEPRRLTTSDSPIPFRTRICGILYCNGCVNSQLVREGIVWHDPANCPSATLAQDQQSARTARRGLWQSDPSPVPPWLWRRQQEKVAAAGTLATSALRIPDLSRYFQADTPPAVLEAAIPLQSSASPSPAAASNPSSPAGDRWLTASSGVRHNSTCRYYKKSKGRPCTANEGQPCQKCGG
ncbi:MAG: thermonuclease family protein [Thermoguttaceae bacterium]